MADEGIVLPSIAEIEASVTILAGRKPRAKGTRVIGSRRPTTLTYIRCPLSAKMDGRLIIPGMWYVLMKPHKLGAQMFGRATENTLEQSLNLFTNLKQMLGSLGFDTLGAGKTRVPSLCPLYR
jgi:hypothetical protein